VTGGELLDQIRSYYLTRLTESWAELCTRPGVQVVREAVLRNSQGAVVREGAWLLPCRVDACVTQNGQAVDSVTVGTERIPSFAPVEFEWSGEFRVRLTPFAWDYCELRLTPTIADPAHLRAWFEHWFDPEDSRPEDENGFKRVVHFMSDPEVRDGATTLLVDLGSAPVEALEQLLDAARASDYTTAQIGQPGE
jgi:hypothetical protein